MKRIVMCVGTWPEDGYKDFYVCDVKPGESDEQAIMRAKGYYNDKDEFYVIDKRENYENIR